MFLWSALFQLMVVKLKSRKSWKPTYTWAREKALIYNMGCKKGWWQLSSPKKGQLFTAVNHEFCSQQAAAAQGLFYFCLSLCSRDFFSVVLSPNEPIHHQHWQRFLLPETARKTQWSQNLRGQVQVVMSERMLLGIHMAQHRIWKAGEDREGGEGRIGCNLSSWERACGMGVFLIASAGGLAPSRWRKGVPSLVRPQPLCPQPWHCSPETWISIFCSNIKSKLRELYSNSISMLCLLAIKYHTDRLKAVC